MSYFFRKIKIILKKNFQPIFLQKKIRRKKNL